MVSQGLDLVIAALRSIPPSLFYVLLFAGFVAEGTALPFVHIPTVVMFLASAVLISTGKLSLAGAILVASAGSTVGALITYWIGRGLAPDRRARRRRVSTPLAQQAWAPPSKVSVVRKWVDRHGALLALAARWLGILRPPALLATGMARISPWKVGPALFLGSLSYCTLCQLLVLEFQSLSLRYLRRADLEMVLASALALALAWAGGIYLLRRARL